MIFLDTLGIFFGKSVAAENSTQTQTKKPKILTKKDPNMKQSIKLKTTTLLVIPLVLACFALLPRAQAFTGVDGGFAGFNTAEGLNALLADTGAGTFNTALGFAALKADTTGSHNTAVGGQALLHNNGSFNTAVGENALVFNTGGSFNMALGQGALASNLAGNNNTAMGFQALNTNTASSNIGVGFQAGRNNTSGTENTAVGFQALFANSTGALNAALGDSALANSTDTIGANTAIGSIALTSSVTGDENTAVGRRALENSNGGSNNTALGWRAGDNVTTASNVTCIGSFVLGANVSNTTYIGGIAATASTTGLQVVLTNPVTNQILRFTSSARYKKDIKPMGKASESIFALKPVTFLAKDDAKGIPQFGLIAEEVVKVNPDLVSRDADGRPDSVSYLQINAMLLNEFLKEHKKVEEQQASIAELKSTVAQQQKGMEVLTAQLKEQAAQIQKVSAQVEMNKSTPKVVANQ